MRARRREERKKKEKKKRISPRHEPDYQTPCFHQRPLQTLTEVQESVGARNQQATDQIGAKEATDILRAQTPH